MGYKVFMQWLEPYQRERKKNLVGPHLGFYNAIQAHLAERYQPQMANRYNLGGFQTVYIWRLERGRQHFPLLHTKPCPRGVGGLGVCCVLCTVKVNIADDGKNKRSFTNQCSTIPQALLPYQTLYDDRKGNLSDPCIIGNGWHTGAKDRPNLGSCCLNQTSRWDQKFVLLGKKSSVGNCLGTFLLTKP